MDNKKLTNEVGAPVAENENSLSAGPRGPVMLQDVWLLEKLAHFDREVIPERRMHAKGWGAYGTFTVTDDITQYTKAKVFSEIGKKTDVIVSGNSASFVLMACANDETIINRIVMVNPQNLASLAKAPTKRSTLVKYLLYTPIIGTFIYNMKVNKRTIYQKFYSDCYYDVNRINEKDILTCFESSHKDKTRSRYLYACQQSRYTNANILFCLGRLNNSIFVISGNGNPENALVAEQYQNYLPSIEIVGINNTKELPHVEKADEFLDQVHVLLSEEV